MAASDKWQVDKEVVDQFEAYRALAKTPKFTTTANGKLVKDALEPLYKKYDIKAICEGSAYPAVMDRPTKSLALNKTKVTEYVVKIATELSKKKGISKSVDELKVEVAGCIAKKGPEVKQTAMSKTGNVGGLTDASGYTGSHAQRFDSSGKGKGIEGRVDRDSNTGYVGNYKGEGSYEKK